MSGIVEAILKIDDPHNDDVLSQGRRHLPPTLTILDFVCGERLIGTLIAEEIIELFQDDHWNGESVFSGPSTALWKHGKDLNPEYGHTPKNQSLHDPKD